MKKSHLIFTLFITAMLIPFWLSSHPAGDTELTSSKKVSETQPDNKLHKQCICPTVMIGSDWCYGSGVIVRSEKIGDVYHNVAITCSHVTQGQQDWTVYVPDRFSGTPCPARGILCGSSPPASARPPA